MATRRKQVERTRDAQTRDERQALLSELFHLASQPLAALQCWLGFVRKRSDVPIDMHDEFESLVDCLAQISWAVAELRHLTDRPTTFDLEIVRPEVEFRALFEELRPVAESCGVHFQLNTTESGGVRLPGRSREIFFRFVESTLASSPRGTTIEIGVESYAETVKVNITSCRKDVGKTRCRILRQRDIRRIQLSRRISLCCLSDIVSAGGGQVQITHSRKCDSVFINIPRVSSNPPNSAIISQVSTANPTGKDLP